MAVEIETRRAAVVEHLDLRAIADAEQGSVQGHRVADPEAADLLFGDGRDDVVMGHVKPP